MTVRIDPQDILPGTINATEFGYLDGVTSNIQVQLNTCLAHIVASGASHIFIDQSVTTLASPVFAGLTVDSPTLVVNALGFEDRVGIGTPTPDSNLHIKGSAATNLKIEAAATTPANLKLTSGAVSVHVLKFQDTVGILTIVPYATHPVHIFNSGTQLCKVSGKFEIETSATLGQQALTIDQNDGDRAFIDFQGDAGAGLTHNINTIEYNDFAAMVMIEIGGTRRWFKGYQEP